MVAWGLAGAAWAGTWSLVPKVTDDTEVRSTMTVDSTTLQLGQTLTSHHEMEAVQRVHGHPDGSATLDVTLTRFEADLAGGAVDGSLLAGAAYEILIGPDGAVRSVSGMDEAIRRAVAAAALPADQKPVVEGTLLGTAGDAAIGRMVRVGHGMLPTRPVAVGERWLHHVTAPMPYGMTIAYTYDCALASVEGTLARITCGVTGELHLDAEALIRSVDVMFPDSTGVVPPEALAAEIVRSVKVQQATGSENVIFDLDRGLVLTSASELTLRVETRGVEATTMTRTATRNIPLR